MIPGRLLWPIRTVTAAKSQGLGKYETYIELDSHADAYVVGKHVLLFQNFN